MPEWRDPYRILQVHREAELDVIRAAYRVLARKLHPDGRVESPLDAVGERRMTDLNWAYSVLRDPQARQRYELDRLAAALAPPAADPTHGAARPEATYDGADAQLDFGRYAGWTLREVAKRDIEYLQWLSRHASGARFRAAIAAVLSERTRAKRAGKDRG
jgi:curved DNA-binding protein CbpA